MTPGSVRERGKRRRASASKRGKEEGEKRNGKVEGTRPKDSIDRNLQRTSKEAMYNSVRKV